MSKTLQIEALSAAAFAPYGDVIEVQGAPDKIINQGLCGRYHDRAQLDFADGRAAISMFQAQARSLPLRLEMVERHPLGSQAFIPLTPDPYLVIVAQDDNGRPGMIKAFKTAPYQGVNYHRGTWHAVLTPLTEPGIFAVIDRVGPGENLVEFWFDEPYKVTDYT